MSTKVSQKTHCSPALYSTAEGSCHHLGSCGHLCQHVSSPHRAHGGQPRSPCSLQSAQKGLSTGETAGKGCAKPSPRTAVGPVQAYGSQILILLEQCPGGTISSGTVPSASSERLRVLPTPAWHLGGRTLSWHKLDQLPQNFLQMPPQGMRPKT